MRDDRARAAAVERLEKAITDVTINEPESAIERAETAIDLLEDI